MFSPLCISLLDVLECHSLKLGLSLSRLSQVANRGYSYTVLIYGGSPFYLFRSWMTQLISEPSKLGWDLDLLKHHEQ